MMQDQQPAPSAALIISQNPPGLKNGKPYRYSSTRTYLLELQHGLIADFRVATGKPALRASLARSFVLVCDALRVARGIPSPGQLRPDLDPVQLEKARRRLLNRGAVQMLKSVNDQATAKGYLEAPPPEDKLDKPK